MLQCARLTPMRAMRCRIAPPALVRYGSLW
jgi:hypothetical protein